VNETVSPTEKLTRYIFEQRGKFNPKEGRVIYRAFLPHPRRETSVCRISGIEENRIFKIGEKIGEIRGKSLKARADVYASNVYAVKLRVQPTPMSDNPRHANIIDWPKEKSEQKLKAIELAEKASLVLPPSVIE